MSSGSFKYIIFQMCLQIIYIYIYIYIYKENLLLNDQQWLMCHKTQPDQNIIPFPRVLALYIYIYIYLESEGGGGERGTERKWD